MQYIFYIISLRPPSISPPALRQHGQELVQAAQTTATWLRRSTAETLSYQDYLDPQDMPATTISLFLLGKKNQHLKKELLVASCS